MFGKRMRLGLGLAMVCAACLAIRAGASVAGNVVETRPLLELLWVNELGELETFSDGATPRLDAKFIFNEKKQSLRGKLTGEMPNNSGAKARFDNHPVLEGLLEDVADPGTDVQQTTLKVSKKGKSRGKFSGVVETV